MASVWRNLLGVWLRGDQILLGQAKEMSVEWIYWSGNGRGFRGCQEVSMGVERCQRCSMNAMLCNLVFKDRLYLNQIVVEEKSSHN